VSGLKKNPKTVIIVQARMGSSRLPGKILLPVLGKTLLQYELERLKRVKSADEIIVATTTDQKDNAVEKLCKQIGTHVFRGSENDVLSRYFEAAQVAKADIVVRVTADCPLIDPEVVDKAITTFIECKSYPYVSNTLERTYPRGLDCEVFSFESLKAANENAKDQVDREHVTPFIKRAALPDHVRNISYTRNLAQHRWTVDTAEDFELIKRIIESLYPIKADFDLLDILKLLEAHPDWMALNAHIEQKAH
jgi:spore coat polysaccharide biosynthesis protein SpsF